MAKAFGQNGSDCEERKLGEQNGLDRFFAKKSSKKLKCNTHFVRLHELLLLIISAVVRDDIMKFYGQINPKYPSSPSCKRCEQGIAHPTRMRSVEEKSLSSPPGKYGRKAETLRNWRGSTTRGAACGSI